MNKKALVIRKPKAPSTTMAKLAVNNTLPPEGPTTISEIDERIAIARDNLRQLVEQAASYSGASDEELMSERLIEQEMKLALLKKQREELSQAIATRAY